MVLGVLLVADGLVGNQVVVAHGRVQTGFEPLSVALGLGGFPALLLAGQWLRTRFTSVRLEATGPISTVLNILVFLALVLTPLYARPLSFTSSAALLFYGASMLLAAVRGYGGCEVLAIANWFLRRDDQIGCLVLSPIDNLESRLGRGSR